MSNTPGYAELHCVTSFSFLRGASQPEELVARAAELGYEALAITDECSVAGVVRAHMAAKGTGLKLLSGTELRLADGPQLILIAPHRRAHAQMGALISLGRSLAAGPTVSGGIARELGSLTMFADQVGQSAARNRRDITPNRLAAASSAGPIRGLVSDDAIEIGQHDNHQDGGG